MAPDCLGKAGCHLMKFSGNQSLSEGQGLGQASTEQASGMLSSGFVFIAQIE